ncbi:MAG: hypothetical protein LBE12_09380 [Planctomycetaceae bacterium]|jgi:hypothetical protein|nr:hypothetical protein [Planctomycetaceae bacterium]
MNNNNIYLELELSLDPAITDTDELKNHLEQKINEWNKLVNASPKFKQKVTKAREFIQNGLTGLTQQANEAKQIRLATLRENIKDLSYSGEIQQFEINYLKRNFPCFNEVTIQNEINNFSRSIISSADEIINTGKSLFSTVKNINFPIQNIFRNIAKNGLGKWILLVPLLLIFLYLVSYIPGIVGGLFQNISGVPSAQSYERGVGSYVNRYANRSYKKAKWETVWDVENEPESSVLLKISGWDKDNLTITSTEYCLSLKNGQWHVNKEELCNEKGRPYYISKDSFMLYGKTMKVYNQTSYSEFNGSSLFSDSIFFSFFQPEKNLVCLVDSHPYSRVYYEYSNQKFSTVHYNDKKFGICKTNNIHQDAKINEIKLVHAFKDGNAISGYKRWWTVTPLRIAKYKNGLWYELYETTHTGDIFSLWAIDENNFTFAGEGITQFRNGIETHPIPMVNLSGWSLGKNWLAVWGVNVDKWWVMDFRGNIVQFENNEYRGVVQGPQLDMDMDFCDAWVSPEGVVYAITQTKVYRLN